MHAVLLFAIFLPCVHQKFEHTNEQSLQLNSLSCVLKQLSTEYHFSSAVWSGITLSLCLLLPRPGRYSSALFASTDPTN